MDNIISPLFFRFGIYVVGILFVLIAIARFTKPFSAPLLKNLHNLSKNKIFKILFFSVGVILGIVIGFADSGGNIIIALVGAVFGIIYFGLIFSVVTMLYEYTNEDEK